MKSGIYQIVNTINGKSYIGSSENVKNRICHHKSRLVRNKHVNIHLQRAVNKNGIENFIFSQLVLCPPEYCIKLEQWFIDTLKPEYNIRKDASSNKGLKTSVETRRKQSVALKGRKRSQEEIDKSQSHRYRAIYQIDSKSLEIINVFPNSVFAGKAVNSSKGTITNAVVGRIFSLKGFIWEYESTYTLESVLLKQEKMSKYKKYMANGNK